MQKQRNLKNTTGSNKGTLEEYLKKLPFPPKEHAHELKMEKRLKRLIAEQEKR